MTDTRAHPPSVRRRLPVSSHTLFKLTLLIPADAWFSTPEIVEAAMAADLDVDVTTGRATLDGYAIEHSLACLRRRGWLVQNRKVEPHEWRLTPTGLRETRNSRGRRGVPRKPAA